MTRQPLVASVVVIFAIVEGELSVLLIHRSAPPEEGRWALPGALWDGSESLEQAATRTLAKETGARDLYLEQLFTVSGLDPAQPVVAVAYFALVDAEAVRLREEQDWAPAWHRLSSLPALAFDNNGLIEQALARVRAKLEYTNIAYGLLPERFTLRELHDTYESILGRALDRRNFRKRLLASGVVEATGERRREGAHRPALLYRFVSREPVFL